MLPVLVSAPWMLTVRIAAVRTPRPICAPSGMVASRPRLETPISRSVW